MKNFLKATAYLAAFIALGAISAVLVFRIINFDKTGEVPDLAGKSVTEASEQLNKRKLLLNIQDKEHSSEIPEGYIISQDIKPGEKIRVGTSVAVTVSMGQEMYSMPSFEGQVLDDAKLTLGNLGMTVKKVTWVHSDSIAKGRIIAQRPLSGNITGNEINFLVSLGPYEVSYKCPSFVNMRIDDARTLAEALGIKLIEKEKGSRIIFQKPEAGAVIKKGDMIDVKLGRGWGTWF